jgi:hypothetical protein
VMDVSFLISLHLRKTDLSPLQGGSVFGPIPGAKTPG